ncbi:type VII secretion protein EccE [Streptomyces sp. NPDC001985]|uniref:type VII secretion protein EccE n=1 Tax=Streptomyces sp. NPDC001985 TaxID=3154406 RepID=UPI00332CFB2F
MTVWGAAAALAAVGVAAPPLPGAASLAAAALLTGVTTVRLGGRSLADRAAARLLLWARGRAPGTSPSGPAAALRPLLPRLSVRRAEGRSRTRLGIVHDGRAWVSLVAVESGPGPGDGGGPRELPLRELGDLLHLDDICYDSVQLLVHSVGAPDGPDGAGELCAGAYRQLNTGSAPVLRQIWVAVRLDEAGCAAAIAARGGGEPGIRRVLRRGVLAAVAVLADAGWRARVLDEEEAAGALAEAAGAPPGPGGATGPAAAESWSEWRAHGTGHVTHRVRKWPRETGLTGLPELLAALPARATALSVTFTTTRECAVAVRTAGAAREAGDGLPSAARALGTPLARLDGEHAAGLLATVPLGLSPGRGADRGRAPAVLPLAAGGVVLGTDRDGVPVPVPLIRREPLRLGVLLERERAALVVFRLLAAGALVHVRSPRPQVWAGLLRACGAGRDRLDIGLPGGATPPPGSPLRPVVVVDEFTGGGGAPRPDLGAWQLGVGLHRQPPGGDTEALRRYDAVLAPRVALPTARRLTEAYGLPGEALRTLPVLPGDASALLLPGELRTLWIRPVPAEEALLTAPVPPSHG